MAKKMSKAQETAKISGFIGRLKKIQINRELKKLSKKDFAKLMQRAKDNAQRYNRPNTKAEVLEIMRELHLQKIIKSMWAKELQSLIDEYDYSVNTIVTSKVSKYRKAAEGLIDPAVHELEMQYREAFNDLKEKLPLNNAAEFQKKVKALHKDPELKEINEAKAYILRSDPISRIGFACRWSITNKPEMKKASIEMQEKNKIQQLETPVIFDQKQYIDVAKQLLDSNDKRELALGLCAATGRRIAEIIKTAKIEAIDIYIINFSGQIKTRGKVRKSYLIPVFIESSKIIDAFNRFRKLILINQKTGDKVNVDDKSLQQASSYIAKGEYYLLKKEKFSKAFNGQKKIELRTAAAFIACKIHKTDKISEEMFIKTYLGHSGFGSILNYRGSIGT